MNERRRESDLRDMVLQIVAGLLLGLVLSYFAIGGRLGKIENRLTTIESVVCAQQTCYHTP